MILTKEFKYILYRLLLVGFIFQLVYFGLKFIDIKEIRFIYNILGLVPSFIFWFAISLITKNQQRALFSFFIQNGLSILGLFYIGIYNIPFSRLIIEVGAPILAFLFFGYDYFKSNKGMLLGVFGLIFSSNVGVNFLGLHWDELLRIVDLNNIFNYSEGTVHINLLSFIFNSTKISFQFVLFWFSLIYFKQFNFKGIIKINIENKYIFSIIFWIFRIVIGGIIFEGLTSFSMYTDYDFLEMTFHTIGTLSFIYVVSSVYRNFLVSYFVERNHYPSWFYYVLNIPILNLIAWIIFMFKEEPKYNSKATILDDLEGVQGIKVKKGTIKGLQSEFINSGKNKGIKTLTLIALFLNITVSLFYMIQYNNYQSLGVVFITFLVTLAFVLLYLDNPKGLYYILGINFIVIYIYSLTLYAPIADNISLYSIVSLIVLYPLFHFDQLTIIDDESKESDKIE